MHTYQRPAQGVRPLGKPQATPGQPPGNPRGTDRLGRGFAAKICPGDRGIRVLSPFPQIMDWIEFFKESKVEDERGKGYAKKFEENR